MSNLAIVACMHESFADGDKEAGVAMRNDDIELHAPERIGFSSMYRAQEKIAELLTTIDTALFNAAHEE